MPHYVTVVPHLPSGEFALRYCHAHDPVDRTHWHLLWLIAMGRRMPDVARLVGYIADWILEIVRRYNAEGPVGIVNRRQHGRRLDGRLARATSAFPTWLGGAALPQLYPVTAPAPRHDN